MPHHVNIRKQRRAQKAMLVGQNPVGSSYEAVVAIYNDGDGYVRTDAPKSGHKIDVYDRVRYKSLVIERGDSKAARREARNHGSLVSLRKIDPEYFLHKIEHLVIPRPTMEVMDTTVTLSKGLEAQKPAAKPKFTIEIVPK